MNRIIETVKKYLRGIVNWCSGIFNNKIIPFLKTTAIWLSGIYRDIILPFIKNAINWISGFYTNKFLPSLKNAAGLTKEFFRLVTLTAKEDNKDLLGRIEAAFSGLVFYTKTAKEKITAFIRELKKQKTPAQKIKPAVSKKKTSSSLEYLSDFVRHIKYLSYRRLILYTLAFILLDIFLLWFSAYRVLYAKHYWDGGQEKKFFIRPGKSLDEIINELKQEDVLESRFIFKVYVKLSGKEEKIISKRYIFTSGLSNSELLNLLTDRNMVQMEKFTVIEGYRIKQIGKIAETKLLLSQERFIQEAGNDSLINILGLKGKIRNLEGFLFPETYYLPLDVDERGLVLILFNEFRKKVLNDEELMTDLKKSKKSLVEIITMASIVQGETNLKDEMGKVSGVYYNRLKKNMRLEADPTIQYILPDGPKVKLKFSDLKINSPYNTYQHFGLPPGPINNPGLYAIKAAINPDKNNFLFFVATGNGGHKFTENYKDHLKAVEEYKKNTEKKSEQ